LTTRERKALNGIESNRKPEGTLRMSEKGKMCYFDNSKQCPVRTEFAMNIPILDLLQRACPICPIREQMMKPKGSLA